MQTSTSSPPFAILVNLSVPGSRVRLCAVTFPNPAHMGLVPPLTRFQTRIKGNVTPNVEYWACQQIADALLFLVDDCGFVFVVSSVD